MPQARIIAQLVKVAASQDRTMYSLARQCDIPVQTVSDFLQGREPAAIARLETLAHALGYRLVLVPEPKA